MKFKLALLFLALPIVAEAALYNPPGAPAPTYVATTLFSAPTGTCAAPTYTFTGDPDTGMVATAANALALCTGGVISAQFTSAGKAVFSTDGIAYADSATTPALQVHGATAAASGQLQGNWVAAVNGSALTFTKSRGGVIGTHATVNSGDSIAVINADGSDGTVFRRSSSLLFAADGTVGAGFVPGREALQLANAAGTLTTYRVTNSTGYTGLGAGIGTASTAQPDATLTVVAPDLTTSPERHRSKSGSVVSTNVVGGTDFMSNDSQLTAPGSVTAKFQARASETHTASALGTQFAWSTTPNTTTAIADSMTLSGAGLLNTLAGYAIAGTTQKFPKTFTATYDPASLAALSSRCDDVTVTGITTTGGAVAANIGAVDPAASCVMATVRASATDTVRICWRNATDAVTACDTASSTWTFTQAQ